MLQSSFNLAQRLIKILDKKYSDEKLAELLDNVKDFNYYELNVEEIVGVIKPIIENANCTYGGITDVKHTSIDFCDEIYFDNKVFNVLLTIYGKRQML